MDINDDMACHRRNANKAETLMVRELSRRQYRSYKFRRKVGNGPFVVEYVCAELKLVVQLYCDAMKADVLPDAGAGGFEVARFRHRDVINDLIGVINALGGVIRHCKQSLAMSRMASRYLSGNKAGGGWRHDGR